MVHRLAELLDRAARGDFPAPDGTNLVLPPPPGRAQAVVAFTSHHVIAADIAPDEVAGRLDPDDIGAAMRHEFITWLAAETGRTPGLVDLVAAAPGTGRGADVEEVEDHDHPRVVRALRYRDEIRVLRSGLGTLILGRGLAGRREVAIEVAAEHRGAGVGRHLAATALDLTPDGEPLFAQVSPGNAASVRAFVAAGFRPIGAEVLLV